MKFINSLIGTILDFFEIAIVSAAVFFVVYLFIGQLLEVTGDSMYPNFLDKERIIAEKVSKKFVDIKRGDVVIVEHPLETDKLLIKRVIGLPGETIEILYDRVYINGSALSEPYLSPGTLTKPEQAILEGVKYKIPDDSYVVMGDNREKSTDSREWGYVSKDKVVGRVMLVYYPLNRIRFVGRSLF